MLTIYFKDIDAPTENIIDDIEEAFCTFRLTGTKVERAAIEEIEKGKYRDSRVFEDRFGVCLYTDCLSSGSKAMMVVGHYPDKVVNCVECGANAITSIAMNCDNGAIIILPRAYGVEIGGDKPINVLCRGHLFTDPWDLNSYLYHDAPYEVDEDVYD